MCVYVGHYCVEAGSHNVALLGYPTDDMTVIFTVFAGRRRYLVLLMWYVTRMLDRGIIDECHLWDYTRDLQDHKYLVSLPILSRDCRVKVMQVTDKATFGEYYRFYAACLSTIIKADDDIVYIDIDAMPAFLRFRAQNPQYLLVLPMTLNNGVCAHLMQERGKLPRVPHTFELKEGGFEDLVKDGGKALWLHDWFLGDGRRSLTREDSASIVVLSPRQRISINMFAICAADLPLLARPDVTADDEKCLTVDIPSSTRRTNCVFTGTVVSHFGFAPQRETGLDGEAERKLLTRYADLCVP